MGAAAALSWWGIHSLLSGTVYDPPNLLMLSGGPDEPGVSAAQDPTLTPTPSDSPQGYGPTGTPTPPVPSSKNEGNGGPSGTDQNPQRTPSNTPPATPSSSGKVEPVTVKGNNVVFQMMATSASLRSATPAAGWKMEKWSDPNWIRVTFTRNDEEVTVFCSWYQHAPKVEIL